MPGTLGFRELGTMAYEPVWHAMQRFTNERGTTAEVEGKRPKEDTKITADVTLTVDATVPGCE